MKRTNNKGFSLIELMVVVAIIGILATMAAPQLQKQIAKARQSEAKAGLSSLFTQLKSFYAEYNTYTTDFSAIGFQPEGNLRYRLGFSQDAGLPLNTYGYTGAVNPTWVNTSVAAVCSRGGNVFCTELASATAATLPNTRVRQNDFFARAAGLIYNNRSDEWAIDQNKNLDNSRDGIN